MRVWVYGCAFACECVCVRACGCVWAISNNALRVTASKKYQVSVLIGNFSKLKKNQISNKLVLLKINYLSWIKRQRRRKPGDWKNAIRPQREEEQQPPTPNIFFHPAEAEVETLCWVELYGSVLHGSGSHWQRYVHFYASCYIETLRSEIFRSIPTNPRSSSLKFLHLVFFW